MPPKKGKKQCAAFAATGECPSGDSCRFPHIRPQIDVMERRKLRVSSETEADSKADVALPTRPAPKQKQKEEKNAGVEIVFERPVFHTLEAAQADGDGDLLIVCLICGVEFKMNPRSQAWYLEHKFNVPKRCKPCLAKRQDQRNRLQISQTSSNR
eukprot:TRINITY_DN32660_c0_g1_i1.p1 TRINITY_DN32660_c0_g1~~TRINITY_DN32660_c0_g1_i1.p1  ORF type:complete len:155 (-),score=27.39 TRINITY_DN32660_c0_g1_i1:47-511(-)